MHGNVFRWLVVALIVHGACGATPRREAMPFRFRQSLLGSVESGPTSGSRKRRPPRPKRGPPIVGSCQSLEGQAFSGKPHEAARQLLSAMLGHRVPDRRLRDAARRIDRARQPRPGDLVFFHTDGAVPAGVVTHRSGPRVTFVRLLGGRARCARLHLRQPHRRRLPGQRQVANSFVRVKRPGDPPDTRYLAGELLAGFAAPPL
jgi:hypothetical protein